MDDEYLQFAMIKAVDVGIFPRFADDETYLKNWEMLEKFLEKIGQAHAKTKEEDQSQSPND